MKKLLVVSHCLLNTASKVMQNETELEEEYRLKRQLMSLVMEQNVQLLQLPCPEFLLYGSQRWGHVKDQFLHPHFKEACKKMLEPVLMQLEEYLTYPEFFHILGIVSVEGSPSCGYHLTCRGEWRGEIETGVDEIRRVQNSLVMRDEPGALMEILEHQLKDRNMNIPIFSMESAIAMLSK